MPRSRTLTVLENGADMGHSAKKRVITLVEYEDLLSRTKPSHVKVSLRGMKKIIAFAWELTKIGVIAALVVVPLRLYVFQPFLVKGDSMIPNFHNGDYLIVDELSYRFRSPERGEVIVLKFPYDPSQRFIKRIVGLPGEAIEIKDGKVVVYHADAKEAFVLDETEYLGALRTPGSVKVQLKEGEYFVLGDNREFSSDSRSWGPLATQYIVGRMLWKIFSFNTFAKGEGILWY